MFKKILIFSFVVLILVVFSQSNVYAKSAEEWCQEGDALQVQGRYDEAIQCFYEALNINVNYEYAWMSAGACYDSLGNTDMAIKCYDCALGINSNNVDAWYGKGCVFDHLGKYNESIQYYDKALTINPNYKPAWNNKGGALDALGKYNEAITCFDNALAIDPNDTDAAQGKKNCLAKLGGNTSSGGEWNDPPTLADLHHICGTWQGSETPAYGFMTLKIFENEIIFTNELDGTMVYYGSFTNVYECSEGEIRFVFNVTSSECNGEVVNWDLGDEELQYFFAATCPTYENQRHDQISWYGHLFWKEPLVCPMDYTSPY